MTSPERLVHSIYVLCPERHLLIFSTRLLSMLFLLCKVCDGDILILLALFDKLGLILLRFFHYAKIVLKHFSTDMFHLIV